MRAFLTLHVLNKSKRHDWNRVTLLTEFTDSSLPEMSLEINPNLQKLSEYVCG